MTSAVAVAIGLLAAVQLSTQTPKYDEARYPPGLQKRYTYTTQPGQTFRLEFEPRFDLEGDAGEWCWDFVRVITDAAKVASYKQLQPCTYVEKPEFDHCGSVAPTPIELTGDVLIEVCSDGSVQKMGFRAAWSVSGGGGGESNCGDGEQSTSAKPAPSTSSSGSGSQGDCGQTTFPPALTFNGAGQITGLQQGIVGGQDAAQHSYPWIVWLDGCGAALINSQWIVTAAHCFPGYGTVTEDANVEVTLGSHTQGVGTKARVSKVIKHESYDDVTTANDITLLKLAEPVGQACNIGFLELGMNNSDSEIAFSDTIQPLCLPDPSDNFQTGHIGEKVVIAGWGSMAAGGSLASRLQHAVVSIAGNAACSRAYSGTGYAYDIDSTMMCAAGPGTDSCQGDSGGPLVAKGSNGYYLAGVVSWGIGCADASYPGVYNHVPSYVDWLNQKMSQY